MSHKLQKPFHAVRTGIYLRIVVVIIFCFYIHSSNAIKSNGPETNSPLLTHCIPNNSKYSTAFCVPNNKKKVTNRLGLK